MKNDDAKKTEAMETEAKETDVEEKSKIRGVPLVYLFMTLLAIIIVLISGYTTETDIVNHGDYKVYHIESGWDITIDGEKVTEDVKFPAKLEAKVGDIVTLTRTMGDVFELGGSLFLRSDHNHVRVFVDDELIYEYGIYHGGVFDVPGSAWLLIDMPKDVVGKTLRIEYDAVTENRAGSIGDIVYGKSGELYVYLLKMNFSGFITSIIIMIVGMFLFVIWAMLKKWHHEDQLLSLSLFALLLGLWSLTETNYMQFFTGNTQMIATLAYEMLILLPMGLIYYFALSKDKILSKVGKCLSYVPIINFVISNLLHFSRVMDLSVSLPLTHICLLIESVGLGIGVVVSILSRRHEEQKEETLLKSHPISLPALGFIVFVFGIAGDVVRYYYSFYSDNALCSRIGMLVFIVCLGVTTMNDNFKMIRLGSRAAALKHLAYRDSLTNLRNRTAYQKQIDEYAENPETMEGVVIINCDLNNLKTINDSEGHLAGDKYISTNAIFLESLFENEGRIYRIGGDEFTIILRPISEKKLEAKIEEIERAMEDEESMINLSYGIARYDSQIDRNIEDTIKRADKKMYTMKKKTKIDGNHEEA